MLKGLLFFLAGCGAAFPRPPITTPLEACQLVVCQGVAITEDSTIKSVVYDEDDDLCICTLRDGRIHMTKRHIKQK